MGAGGERKLATRSHAEPRQNRNLDDPEPRHRGCCGRHLHLLPAGIAGRLPRRLGRHSHRPARLPYAALQFRGDHAAARRTSAPPEGTSIFRQSGVRFAVRRCSNLKLRVFRSQNRYPLLRNTRWRVGLIGVPTGDGFRLDRLIIMPCAAVLCRRSGNIRTRPPHRGRSALCSIPMRWSFLPRPPYLPR